MDLFGSPLTVSLDPGAMQALRDIQYAVANAGKATKEAGEDAQESAEGGWTELKSKIELVTGAISTAIETITGAASAIAELTAEQQRLDTQSARLNLDFDQAAAAAGRFADETDAMRVATTAAESGLRMTQTELDAFMRRAGQYSQATGQDMAQATQRLTEALMAGSQEGLNRFGGELARAAVGGSTLGERLQALVTDANDVEAATDDAATAMERAQDSFDDMKRSAAAAFSEQLNAANLLNRALGEADDNADDTSDKLRALGRLGADTVQAIAGTIGTVIGGIAYLAASAYASINGLYSAVTRFREGGSLADMRAAFVQGEREGLDIRDRIEGFTLRSAGAVTDVMDGTTQDQARERDAARAQARRDQETADRIGAETLAEAGFNPDGTPRRGGARGRRAGGSGGGSGRSGGGSSRAVASGQDALSRAADGLLGRIIARARGLAEDVGQSLRDREIDAEMSQRRSGVLRAADRGTMARTAGAKADQNERDERDREIARERSFSDQLEEQFSRRVTLAQEMADGVRSAYDQMAGGARSAYAAIVEGGDELGVTLRKILSQTLLAIGQEATVKALLNTAEGIAAIATYRYDAAASHFAAAGTYAAVAALAGIGASAAAPAGKSPASGDQRAAPVSDRQRASGASGQGTVVNVNVSGFVVGSAGEVARQLTNVLRLGYDQAGVTIPQRAVG